MCDDERACLFKSFMFIFNWQWPQEAARITACVSGSKADADVEPWNKVKWMIVGVSN